MANQRFKRLHGVVFIFTLLSACAGESDPPVVQTRSYSLAEVGAELGFEKYLAITPVTETTLGNITAFTYDNRGPARCRFGTPYVVSVRKGTSPNVMLYLQGGGACWSEDTCYIHPIATDHAEPLSAADASRGVFSSADGNPFKNWSVVFAAYCDGSMWMGDADVVYGSQSIAHHGLANATAAVALLKSEFPSPAKLVVAGSSAGGYGTLAGYIVARTVFPHTKMYVLNDSGPWVLNRDNPDMTEGILAKWNFWNAEAFMAPACAACRIDLFRIASWAMTEDPDTRWGLFSYDRDFVIAELYMKYGNHFADVLHGTIDFLEPRHPGQFHAFVASGSSHTLLMTDAVFEKTFDDDKLSDWIGLMISDSAAWASVNPRERPQ
jgi:hypothetical protein